MTLAEERERYTDGGGGEEGKEKKEKLQNDTDHHYLQSVQSRSVFAKR